MSDQEVNASEVVETQPEEIVLPEQATEAEAPAAEDPESAE